MWRDIRIEQEQLLSPLAAHSVNSLGRRLAEEPCKIRSDYERDADRILYSEEFRRLRHKTQVFFNAKNDHICTRMEHVLYVRAISTTIGRTLGLNQDLINAIALGHDIGMPRLAIPGNVRSITVFKRSIHSFRSGMNITACASWTGFRHGFPERKYMKNAVSILRMRCGTASSATAVRIMTNIFYTRIK